LALETNWNLILQHLDKLVAMGQPPTSTGNGSTSTLPDHLTLGSVMTDPGTRVYDSISLTISKKRSTSISRGDSSSGSSDSNTEIQHRLSMQSEKSKSVNKSCDGNEKRILKKIHLGLKIMRDWRYQRKLMMTKMRTILLKQC